MWEGWGKARLVLGAVFVALLCGPGSAAHATDAKIIAEERIGPRVIELTISTPAFSEPTKVDVDLPTGYDENADRRWPVTYFLAGTMNTYRSFNTFVDGVGLTKSYPSILVSPNGDSGYWSDWYNAGDFGPPMYETYVVDQLIPLIDARFRTISRRSKRAVMGVSMGGYGAMMTAARHPDEFVAAASLSGAVDSNLPANGAVLSASPTFQGAQPDAIYGPRATQEVRWRGHNPTDLADNLRDLDLQLLSANGTPNPAIGEEPGADTVSCVVEGGVYMASVDMHDKLDALRIPHAWHDYGAGCHTKANFTREIVETLRRFAGVFADPPPAPDSFAFRSIEPDFDIWDWHVEADPGRALEFMRLEDVSAAGLTLVGSGRTKVVSPRLFRGVRRVGLRGAAEAAAIPSAEGRISFTVDLGKANADQQYTAGAITNRIRRAVTFEPYAHVKITRVRVSRRHVRVCVRPIGGELTARVHVRDRRGRSLAHRVRLHLASEPVCRKLRWKRGSGSSKAKVFVAGRDTYGHRVRARRAVRRTLP